LAELLAFRLSEYRLPRIRQGEVEVTPKFHFVSFNAQLKALSSKELAT